ncbi:MAG: hypothetical protein M1838_000676 [Thelocarpon superellum]|nr:MAG: hypothetical protein M1838_000676 [Thelocarpon superellum]
MRAELAFPKQARSTVNRYRQRGSYDLSCVHGIVNATSVLHVSFVPDADDVFPAILPMIGTMASFEFPSAGLDEPLDCYLHGYVSSRLIKLARQSGDTGGEGLPVCVAATKVDGIVLSLTPNSHSYNYRSAVIHGYASVVESDEEKVWAMERITNGVVTDRWAHTRVPPDKAEMDSTRILRVRVVSGSAKIRQGEPHDAPKDLEREEVVGTTWTGVVPIYEHYSEPVAGEANHVPAVPEYLCDFVQTANEDGKRAALDAVKEPSHGRNVSKEP